MRANKNILHLTNQDVIRSFLKYFIIFISYVLFPNYLFIFIQSIIFKFKFPNLKEPKYIYEKIVYMKLNYKDPLLTLCSNKLTLNNYTKFFYSKILTPPNLKVFYSFIEFKKFNFEDLEFPIIIKGSNRSGGSIIVMTYNDLCSKRTILNKYINFLFFSNYYYYGREWAYKNSQNQIIIEKFLGDKNFNSVDYKFYIFGGKVLYFMISTGELSGNVKNHKFDVNLKSIDHFFKLKTSINENSIHLSRNIKEMIEISNTLGAFFPHVRIDFFESDKGFYLNEMTFYSSSGFIKVHNKSYDSKLADLIQFKNEYLRDKI
jgi:glutathione synthase/RimK-type ligase-like ATP-grasp enzyme